MAFHKISDPERLHALIDAIFLIETNADLDGLLSRITETAARLVGARYAALGVIAADGSTLSRFITYGIDAEQRNAIGAEPSGRGLVGEVIRQRSTLRIDELSNDPRATGFPLHHPRMRRFLGVPVLTGDGHIFGSLYLTDPEHDLPFSEDDEHVAEAFGRAAGLVIDQELLRSNVRTFTLSEERERLARDLHDTVIQRLFGVGLALQNTLSSIDNEEVRGRVNHVLDELDATIQEIRTTIFEIDTDTVNGRTVANRIHALCHDLEARLGVVANVTITGDIDVEVGPQCGHNALQALREILSNVVRHSNATEVDIQIILRDDDLEVHVRDNGVGFTPNVGSGRGVRNLVARARALGGTCAIDSTIGGGTTVQWTANRTI